MPELRLAGLGRHERSQTVAATNTRVATPRRVKGGVVATGAVLVLGRALHDVTRVTV